MKICPNCKQENQDDYKYCIVCGGLLDIPLKAEAPSADYVPVSNAATQFSSAETEKVSPEEFYSFVGSGAEKLFPKYRKQKMFGGKVGFNLPTFLFGLLLNMPFIWLFYRKMYKAGLAVLAACAALAIASTVAFFSLCGAVMEPMFDMMAKYPEYFGLTQDEFQTPDDFGFETTAVEKELTTPEQIEEQMTLEIFRVAQENTLLIGIIEGVGVANLVLTLLLSLFADRLYFNHLEKRVLRHRVELEAKISQKPLYEVGGKSVGAAVGFAILFSLITLIVILIGFGWLTMQASMAMMAIIG